MLTVPSADIRVFPTTLRENIDPSAKFTTEYNLTSLLNKLLDRKAFVITSENDFDYDPETNIISALEFNIMGYFFSITNFDISSCLTGTSTTARYINASITIGRAKYDATETEELFLNHWTLNGNLDSEDNTTNYSGISFSSSTDQTYTLMETFKSKLDENIKFADAGVTLPEDFGISGEAGDTKTFVFTILQYKYNESTSTYDVWIPKESRIKFQTNTNGSQHSLAIDDGELTPVARSFNLRNNATEILEEEIFDGLMLNVNSLTLRVNELFRLEAEYDKEGDVVFTSSDTNIATVSSNGLVRGINKGNCLVVASYKDKNAVCNITVK